MWLLPSRGRPAILARFFESFIATGATSPGAVRLDDDDLTLDEYANLTLPDGWKIVVGPRIGCSTAQNELFWANTGCAWYGILGDDAMPVTQGWDRMLIEAAGSDCIAYANDGINKEDVVGHSVIGGDLARKLGWVMLPGLKRIYGDNVLADIGYAMNCLRYLPECIVEHWHFSNGKAPFDATYDKGEDAANDQAIYMAWRANL